MTTRNINILWKSFKGIRSLNTINSDVELGADIAHGVRLSKEKSGQFRSIRSSGWYNKYAIAGEATATQTVGTSLSDLAVAILKFANKNGDSLSGSIAFTYDGDKWINADSEEILLSEYGISYAGTPVANDEITVTYDFENIIRLFSANMSGYTGGADQMIAFTKTSGAINVWLLEDNTLLVAPLKIATFPLVSDVTDVCMVQWGDRLGVMVAFGNATLGFMYYAADAVIGGTQMGTSDFYYKLINVTETTTHSAVDEITSICPYRSRLAINGVTTYNSNGAETIYGVWFSEAGDPTNFTMDYMADASETSAFFVETGEKVNKLEEYHGLTAFCRNRSYNITGTSQTDVSVETLTAKGVFGNGTFSINGKCAYIDSYSNNIFTLRDNIDGTIGFDNPVGDDIQAYLSDIENVTINSIGRRVRLLKPTGQSLVYDFDIGEWTEEAFSNGSRAITFLNKEMLCDGTPFIYEITENWNTGSLQEPDEDGYYSHYRTNLMWLDSQSSVKNHLYPFAIVLEPQTSNDFYIKFTIDRARSFNAHITKAGYENVAIYSNDDNIPENGSMFVNDDDDLSGRVFFSLSGTELLVTVDRPPFWRYLQIDIYTTQPYQRFNISGIEAKNTVITDEMLEY